MTEKERLIICKRLGINGSASSLEKIADEYNVNTASIYNIEKKAIRKLLQNKINGSINGSKLVLSSSE